MSRPVEPAPSAVPAFAVKNQAGALMGRRGVPLGVPLPFLITGSALAVLAGLLLPFVLPDALTAPALPHVLALVHTLTLGWLTMTMMGASLQLTPVIVVAPLRVRRLTPLLYPLYLPGVLLLLLGFWLFLPWLLVVGAAFVVSAVCCYVLILAATLARAARRPLTTLYLAGALLYLCLVVALGGSMALNFVTGALGLAAPDLLPLHVTLGVVGWLTNMLVGVSYTLVPLFALVHDHNRRLAQGVLLLLNAGLVGLIAGLLSAVGWLLLLGAGLLCAGVWLFAGDYLWMLHRRRRRLLEVTQYHGLAGLLYLVAAATVLPPLTLGRGLDPGQAVALLLALLLGWTGQSVVGYLYKIVPFLVWHSRYGPLVGRQRVPLMRDLVHQRLAWLCFWLFNGGLPLLLLAVLRDEVVLLRLAAALVGLALVGAAVNVGGVVRHLNWRWSTLRS